jgi:hypothetical protein
VIKIDQKIVNYEVVKEQAPVKVKMQELNEEVARPESLQGKTYKLKTPLADHAVYITINDYVLDPGTEHERRRPFEIFINCKDTKHFQWIVALTRIISAVFRKGGEVGFIVEELQSVFDPNGGYLKRGGFVPSLVAEIGKVMEAHMIETGAIVKEALDPALKAYIEEKQREVSAPAQPANRRAEDPKGGPTLCGKCGEMSVIVMDNCAVCTSCADSKCA